jgi:CRISPR-associated protein Cmr6
METRRTSLKDVASQNISNASLWLDKFIAGQNRKDERTETSAEKFKQQLINETAKIKTPDIYQNFFVRWKDSLTAVGAKFKNFKVEGRMVIGLGAEGVSETSIALHRTYGVPFISGSALKGLAASYAHKCLGDDWKKETKATKLGKAHGFVFGSQSSAGFITFHDAMLIPKTRNPLHADVMTVHHSDYYGEKTDGQDNRLPPADWDNPVPIPFLSATGNYLVAISSVEGAEDWIKFVFAILEKALQEEGIGAKTSSGYGRGSFEKSKEDEAEEQAKISTDGFVKRVDALKNNDVAGRIGNFYQEWKNTKGSNSLRKVAAQAIIEKVREAGREKQSKGKAWFDELQNFVSEN